MNIQPGSSGRRKKTTVTVTNQGGGFDALCGLAVRIINIAGVVGSLAVFFYFYITLEQEIYSADAAIRQVKEEQNSIDREIVSLQGQRDYCTSHAYIRRQVARFNLPLVELGQDRQENIRLYSKSQLAQLRRGTSQRSQVAMDNNRRGEQRSR